MYEWIFLFLGIWSETENSAVVEGARFSGVSQGEGVY